MPLQEPSVTYQPGYDPTQQQQQQQELPQGQAHSSKKMQSLGSPELTVTLLDAMTG
jgi:hypothetical protein